MAKTRTDADVRKLIKGYREDLLDATPEARERFAGNMKEPYRTELIRNLEKSDRKFREETLRDVRIFALWIRFHRPKLTDEFNAALGEYGFMA